MMLPMEASMGEEGNHHSECDWPSHTSCSKKKKVDLAPSRTEVVPRNALGIDMLRIDSIQNNVQPVWLHWKCGVNVLQESNGFFLQQVKFSSWKI